MEAAFEPIEPDKDDKGMDDNRIGDHSNKVKYELLVGMELIDVHRIQTALSCRTAGEVQSVDVSQAARREDEQGANHGEREHVHVVD